MRIKSTLYSTLVLAFALALPCAAQDNLNTLQQQVAAQQKQLEDLKKQLESQQKLIEQLSSANTESKPERPMVASTAPVAIGPAANQQTQLQPSQGAKQTASPLSFRIGEAEFTPGGFMDFTSIYRTTNVGSGIGTSFGGIPFGNAAAGRIGENRFSAQNSRLTLKVATKYHNMGVTGYLETDFLGNAPANLNVSSNANTLRMRLYWVDIRPGNWEFLGGQSWSMMTPGRTGISPAPSDLFYTQDVDTNYQAGLIWTRAPQFRAVYHAKNGFHIGFALENPQQYSGTALTVPTFVGSQLDANATTSTPNSNPDLQAKIAYDAKPGGHAFHIEAAGVFRQFKLLGPTFANHTVQGGGGELNFNVELFKNFRLLATSFYSSGGGRYIYGLAPDVAVRADGTLSGIRSASGIGGFEYTPNAHSMFYAYYSTVFVAKNYSLEGGKYYGYGYPGSPSSQNRTIQEYTVGYTHTFWKSANHGAIQLMNQYSYLVREPWAVTPGLPSSAHTNMVYNNLRYVLP